jgi:hypothetical protein
MNEVVRGEQFREWAEDGNNPDWFDLRVRQRIPSLVMHRKDTVLNGVSTQEDIERRQD